MTADEGLVYEIHFDQPIGDPENPKGAAQHYIGHTEDLDRRLAEHRSGHTAAIMRAVNEAGIGWHLVRTWPGTRDTERQIKLLRSGRRLCPECTEHPLTGAGAVARAAALRQHREAQAARRQRQEARLETLRAGQAGQREAARAAAAADPYEDGRRMARQWLARQDEAGRTAGQIEATHEYVTGPWREMTHHTEDQAERYRGYTELVRAALAEFREMEAETGPAGPGGDEMEEQMQYEPSPDDLGVSEDPGSAADLEPESDGLDGLGFLAAERAEANRLETGTPEYDAGSWLARDGDGQVLEVDADGHPGREASPDDGRAVAEAESGDEAQYTGEPGWTAADADNSYWHDREGEARTAEHDLQSARAGMDSFGSPVGPERAAGLRADAEGVRREYETERREREAAREAEAG